MLAHTIALGPYEVVPMIGFRVDADFHPPQEWFGRQIKKGSSQLSGRIRPLNEVDEFIHLRTKLLVKKIASLRGIPFLGIGRHAKASDIQRFNVKLNIGRRHVNPR